MRLEDQLLEALKSNNSVFRFIPDNIGDIAYCDSTNPKDCPDTKEQTRKKVALSVLIPCAIAAFCWFVFDESPIFDSIVSVVMFIIMVRYLKKCYTFKGTDYFVGTEGAAVIEFDNTRDNITNKTILKFEDFDDLVTGETRRYRNGSYEGTEYYFIIYGHKVNNERKVISAFNGTYNQEKPGDYYTDQQYRFWKTVEMKWSRYKLELLKVALDNGESIGFNLYTDKNFYNNYLVFQGSQLTIGGTLYDKNTVKKIGFSNGNLIVEHANHSSKFFGLIEKGNKDTIPLHMIGNRELFFTFFQYFTSTL